MSATDNLHFIGARGVDTQLKHPVSQKQVKAKDAGAVYAYRTDGKRWAKRIGKAPKAYYGSVLVNAGDIDGDGVSDMINASAFMSRVSSIHGKWLKNMGFVEAYSGAMLVTETQ